MDADRTAGFLSAGVRRCGGVERGTVSRAGERDDALPGGENGSAPGRALRGLVGLPSDRTVYPPDRAATAAAAGRRDARRFAKYLRVQATIPDRRGRGG